MRMWFCGIALELRGLSCKPALQIAPGMPKLSQVVLVRWDLSILSCSSPRPLPHVGGQQPTGVLDAFP